MQAVDVDNLRVQLDLYKGYKENMETYRLENEQLKDQVFVLELAQTDHLKRIKSLEKTVETLQQDAELSIEKSNQLSGLLEKRQIQKMDENKQIQTYLNRIDEANQQIQQAKIDAKKVNRTIRPNLSGINLSADKIKDYVLRLKTTSIHSAKF